MSLEKKILEDIQKTGFVTELKVVSLLIEKGWSTEHSTTYEDKDENISREIDILASKVTYIKQLGFRLTFYLVIETKKTDRPWIVFTTSKKFPELGWRIMHRTDNIHKWNPVPEMESGGFYSSIFDLDCLEGNPRNTHLRIGKAFHELGKSPKDKSQIYEGLITCGKAARYFKDKYQLEKEITDFMPEEETDVAIYLPTVVLDGLLYEVYNDEKGEITIHEETFIPIEMKYSSPHYRQGDWDLDLHPDIVSFKYLSDHLDELDKWKSSMLEKMTLVLKKLNKQPYSWFSKK